MKVAVVKETAPGERRVALVPEMIARLRNAGLEVLAEADLILGAGELTLAQSAARTGYASPYTFAAAFRRHHGQPPGQQSSVRFSSTAPAARARSR
jgi:methylphosphotriester-DNA--protein-cysteine methyltransferase